MLLTCYPSSSSSSSHRQKKGGRRGGGREREGCGAKKAHPEMPALSSWNFYYWFVPLLPRSSPQKERKTRGKEARKRRIRVERTCDATMRCFQYIRTCVSTYVPASYLRFPSLLSSSPALFLSALQAYWQSIILIKVCGKSSQKDRAEYTDHELT